MKIPVLALLSTSLSAFAADSVVVFNELQYHPANEVTQTEWIELRNMHGVDVDISGWRIEGGVDFTFPEGTKIAGGAFLVVAKVPSQIPGAVGPFAGILDNGGEELRLVNRSDRSLDVLSYSDDGDWATGADGSGATLARRNGLTANGGPGAWAASNELGGTPGAVNFLDAAATPKLSTPVLITAPWKYDATDVAPAGTWKDAGYNDSAWPQGGALLFAGTGKVADPVAPSIILSGAGVGMHGWWAFQETTGTTAANSVGGGTAGALTGAAATFQNDGTRGRVIRLNTDGSTNNTGNSFVSAGTVPAMTLANNFTWAFWSKTTDTATTEIIVGNRYNASGTDFSPREFIKFTNQSFEWHRNAAGENVEYVDMAGTFAAPGPWIHHAVVKEGSTMRYYRNGVIATTTTITAAPVNAQPLFFGANGPSGAEPWSGYLDDVATWTRALPVQAISGLAAGTYTPATAPTVATPSGGIPGVPVAVVLPTTTTTPLTDDFTTPPVDALKWITLNQGLESTADGGLTATVSGGQVALGGTTAVNFWAGKSLQSVQRFSSRAKVTFTVDRVSLSGTGTAYRSSMWLHADAGHYLHFSQNVGEGGWGFNSNDVGGTGTVGPTGGGTNLGVFDGSDANLGACTMQLVWTPSLYPGSGTIEIFRNGVLGATQSVTNWPADFSVMLTGQARQAADTVNAVFDNAAVAVTATVPLQTNVGAVAQTTYARSAFTFTGNPAATTLSLYRIHDDGAVYYLNGAEIYRDNMPGGAPAHGTVASSAVADAFFNTTAISVPATALVQGANVLAVETHQASPTGGDFIFGAQLHAAEIPAPPADTAPALVWNEIGGLADVVFRVELANVTGSAINLANYQVRGSNGGSYTLSGSLAAGALLSLDHTQLGFRPLASERLFIVNTLGVTLSDSRTVTATTRARTSAGVWGHPNAATFGTANTFTVHDGIVINEIMYNAPGASLEQWVELYNKSGGTVDLSGWHFTDGTGFTFPPGTMLGAGQYAVVVWDVAAFNLLHPALPNVFGPLSGGLSGKGERVRLRDASDNLADELEYSTGGNWPDFADGGGSSLELRNPNADNTNAAAWAASNEVAAGTWVNVSYDFSGANLEGNPTYYSELLIGMVAGGEAFIDDLAVIEDPLGTPISLLANGDFAGGTSASWRSQGNHRTSTVVDDPIAPGNKVLKIVGTGYTEHMSNHIEQTLRNGATLPWVINVAKTYRISYRARWAGGGNRLHTRLYFNRGARQEVLPMPVTAGTPGLVNSRFIANAGPTFTSTAHWPAVPAATVGAVVSARIADSDGVASATLNYAVNGGAFIPLAMSNSGGLWSETIPGQALNAKAQFYITAADTLGATATFPATGTASRAMVPWDDGQAALLLGTGVRPHNVRIVMTTTDGTALHAANNVMSNEYRPCTVIYDERDIYYNVGVHLKGSEHGRAKPAVRTGFHVSFSPDQLFLGQHADLAMDRSGAGDQFSQKEMLVKRTLNSVGNIPVSEDDICRLIAPGVATGPAILIKAKVDSGEYLDHWFANAANGTFFEYELTYPLYNAGGIVSSTDNGTWEGNKLTQDNPGPPGVGVRALSPGLSKEEYRWFWLIKNNRSADNYAPLMTALTALGQASGLTFISQTNALLDVDGWLRNVAGPTAWSAGDNYAFGSAHNALFYVKPDGRLLFVPWDMDFTASGGATAAIIGNGELTKLTNDAANRRAYYGHLLDLCNRSFNTTFLTQWAQHYTKFVNEDLTTFMTFVSQRETHIRNTVAAAIPSVAYAFSPTPAATVAANSITLTGTGWVNIREFRRADTGAVLPATWTGNTTWSLGYALVPGANAVAVRAYDFQGALIGTINATVTNTLTPPTPHDWLRITEVHYNPANPTTAPELAQSSDNDDFEFIELHNLASATLDISGCKFTLGVDFTFAATTTLAPGERIHVTRHAAAFAARYGAGPRVATGQYGPADALSNGGETITLVDATGAEIQTVSYVDSWHSNTDGSGYSLIAIVPTSTTDKTVATGWRSSTAVGGNPNSTDAVLFSGIATDDLDGDGLNAFLEHALGTSDAVPTASGIAVTRALDGSLTATFTSRYNADDVIVTLEVATTLPAFATTTGTLLTAVQAGATLTQSWHIAQSGGAPQYFVRLKATAR